VLDAGPTTRGAHQSPEAASFSTSFSRVRSATARRSLPFSCSSTFRHGEAALPRRLHIGPLLQEARRILPTEGIDASLKLLAGTPAEGGNAAARHADQCEVTVSHGYLQRRAIARPRDSGCDDVLEYRLGQIAEGTTFRSSSTQGAERHVSGNASRRRAFGCVAALASGRPT
jgi:hypothetical protein